MSIIADSTAYLDRARILPHHQAALTLLQALLADPKVLKLRWLDLACGRGQVLAALERNLSALARNKIVYHGYDGAQEFARATEKLASALGFSGYQVEVGDLINFPKLYESNIDFDFISFTNTVHEVAPDKLAQLLVDCISRLAPQGCLFIYDMERLDPPELGAVPWSQTEVSVILQALFAALEVREYSPEVAHWSHRSTGAWSAQVRRNHLDLPSSELHARRNAAISSTAKTIRHLMTERLFRCVAALESLTRYGAETEDEGAERQRLLYEHWALTRAIGVGQ
ncbi:class I SAM-dependent methyltransferase [Nannocystis sp. RBIL2]|uniref:class I SAM-dependent methyltransferase n=1 Tax=Nannocystis sp. RBIL2 TaxID=2996788 RepID=UPI00226DCADB|nr:class I SAM-dependent methyltransferase [Nannocystis sp. RBIL2]MCY1067940.1 class I SAM-dependent methyltransferase [Nannocystis sp. RBIL2]